MKLCIKSMTLCLCLSMGFACSMAYGQSIGAEEDPFPPELQVDPLIPPTPPEEELPRDPGNALVFPNARVNQDAGTNPQNETTIAVNPLGIDNYVAGANDYRAGDSRCGFYYSADSAQTWHDGMAALAGVLPLQAGYTSGGDPAVAFDNAGRAYYACMNFNRVNNNTGMYVFRSTDGGQTYPLSALVVSGIGPIDFNDKEYIATDKFTNNVYMSWTHFIPGASPIMFAGSPAAPFAFNSPLPKVISDQTHSPHNQGSVPAGGSAAGQIYVAWFNADFPAKIQVAKTINGGTTFAPPVPVNNITPLPANLSGEYGNFRVNSFPTLDVCRNPSSPFFGQVYVAWADYRNGDADILFSRSTNGGLAWSPPLRINNDLLHNGKDQFFPWMSVDQNCKINVSFYDRRDDPANLRFHLYFTHSTDGGVTFVPNLRVTTVAATNAQFGGAFIGDYTGLASTNGTGSAFHHDVPRAVPIWTDTRNGNQDAFAATVLQIGNSANIDLVFAGPGEANDFDLVFPGNLVGRFSAFYKFPFQSVGVTFDPVANQTTVRFSNPAGGNILPGGYAHVGFVATMDPHNVKSAWSLNGQELSPPVPAGSVDFRYNAALRQFSVRFCNDNPAGTSANPVQVADLQFAVLDLPLELDVLNRNDLGPALNHLGVSLQPVAGQTGPIGAGQCAPPLVLPVAIEPFQAVVLTGTQSFANDPDNQVGLFGQAVAKLTQICDVNRDNQVDARDIQALLALRNTQAPVGYPSDANGLITVNVARDCVNQCTHPKCAP